MVSLKGILQKDLTFVMFYSLISLIINVLFLFKQYGLSGLSPDSLYYIDIAENIAQGNGFVWHTASFYSDNLRLTPLSEKMPLYPFFISLLIKLGLNSTLSARLVPIIFLTLIPVPMYYLAKEIYGRTIAHASTIYLIFLWAFIYVGSYAWTETTFIFFVLMSILFLYKLLIPTNEPIIASYKIIGFISGIFIGLAYLTRVVGVLLIPVAFCIIFFLMRPIKCKIKHKMGLFLLLLAGFLSVTGLWLVRIYFIFGNPFYSGGHSSLYQIPTFQIFLSWARFYDQRLFPLVLFLPYSLKYLLDENERRTFLLLASFPVIMILFLSGWTAVYIRHLIPTFPLLVIIGMKSFFDIVGWMKKRFKVVDMFSKALIVGLMILFILPQVMSDVNYYIEISQQGKDTLYDSADWIKANTNQNDVILSNGDLLYYYTKRYTVGTAGSPYPIMNYSSFADAITRLNISYVVLLKLSNINKESSGDVVYNLSQGRNVPPNLDIVYNKTDAIIYRVKSDKTQVY